MAAGRALLALGLVCLAAGVYAQTTDFASQLLSGNVGSGSYLVDGTGVVYDGSEVTIYLNGTAIGNVPISEFAHAPASSTHTIDLTKTDPPSPGASYDQTDIFGTILGQLVDKPATSSNPLNSIIIGRKMLL